MTNFIPGPLVTKVVIKGDCFGIYGQLKTEMFIWDQVLGTERGFDKFREPTHFVAKHGLPQWSTSFQSSVGIWLNSYGMRISWNLNGIVDKIDFQ